MAKDVHPGDVVMINDKSMYYDTHDYSPTNPINTYGVVIKESPEYRYWFEVIWENGCENDYKACDLDIHLKFSESTDEVRSMLYPKLFSLMQNTESKNESD